MGARGRKSSTELTTQGAVTLIERPDVPLELTPEQAAEWAKICDTKPADWFNDGNVALLVQHCRHIVEARRIAQLIDQECAREDLNMKTYLDLLNAQRHETAALKAGAAAMRLSQQAQYGPRSAATADRSARMVKRPWQSD